MTEPTKPKWNRWCASPVCDSRARDGDIFCSKCYKSLPDLIRNALWSNNMNTVRKAIEDAKNWFQDRHNAIPVVQDEGP